MLYPYGYLNIFTAFQNAQSLPPGPGVHDDYHGVCRVVNSFCGNNAVLTWHNYILAGIYIELEPFGIQLSIAWRHCRYSSSVVGTLCLVPLV